MFEQATLEGYRPGALADVVKLHTDYYGKHWGFGRQFETKVAREMAVFLHNFDSEHDRFVVAYDGTGSCLGSISLNATDHHAVLRWFIVSEQAAGHGLGRRLLSDVIRHCDEKQINPIQLSTFAGLAAARALYEDVGFRLVAEKDVDQWGGGVTEQHFCRDVSAQTINC